MNVLISGWYLIPNALHPIINSYASPIIWKSELPQNTQVSNYGAQVIRDVSQHRRDFNWSRSCTVTAVPWVLRLLMDNYLHYTTAWKVLCMWICVHRRGWERDGEDDRNQREDRNANLCEHFLYVSSERPCSWISFHSSLLYIWTWHLLYRLPYAVQNCAHRM